MSLMPLALKLPEFKYLTFLDLSYNKMDDSSVSIIDFLQREDCVLSTLLLNGADVDDDEAGNLMEAFASNKSVTTLGLAHNKIGGNEILNTVKPDVTTGGEAIAGKSRSKQRLTLTKRICLHTLSFSLVYCLYFTLAMLFDCPIYTLFYISSSFTSSV